ncbi:hypothetical protein HYD67_00860 [Mycoplasmopsis bovis]|nr:hypothetical protein [Mycoplasmopsis bovis]QQH54801.1 hypothetical protein HYD67_00860 [Mycoplasmopsis bovis]
MGLLLTLQKYLKEIVNRFKYFAYIYVWNLQYLWINSVTIIADKGMILIEILDF